jgi:hypothetical protein
MSKGADRIFSKEEDGNPSSASRESGTIRKTEDCTIGGFDAFYIPKGKALMSALVLSDNSVGVTMASLMRTSLTFVSNTTASQVKTVSLEIRLLSELVALYFGHTQFVFLYHLG